MLGNGCDNARSVDRKALESRVLTRLHERMMKPGIAAKAMRAYAQETNRFNRQRRSSSESTRPELAEDAKAIAKIVRVTSGNAVGIAPADRAEVEQDSLAAR